MLEKLFIVVAAIMGICLGLSIISLGLILLINAAGLTSLILSISLIPLSICCFLLGAVFIVITIMVAWLNLAPPE